MNEEGGKPYVVRTYQSDMDAIVFEKEYADKEQAPKPCNCHVSKRTRPSVVIYVYGDAEVRVGKEEE